MRTGLASRAGAVSSAFHDGLENDERL
jgi:hypothetical protein